MIDDMVNPRYGVPKDNGTFLGTYGLYDLWIFHAKGPIRSIKARYGKMPYQVLTGKASMLDPLVEARRRVQTMGVGHQMPTESK